MKRESKSALRLRILMLEDNPADAELVLYELRRGGTDAETVRVITREEFEAQLEPCPDAILSDYQLPLWSGLDALRLVRARGLDVPFIIVSGTIGEDLAVEAMRHGADDYLLKDRLSRLGAALVAALERKRLREEARKAAEALREREAGLRQAQQIAKLAHIITGPGGAFESWSETLPALLGMEPARLPKSTREWLTLVHPDHRTMFRDKCIEAGKNRTRVDMEYRLQPSEGEWIHVRQVIEPLQEKPDAAGRTRWFNTVQDITDQKRADLELQRLSLAIRQSASGVMMTDPSGAIEYVNPKFEAMTGYSAAEVKGKNPRIFKSGVTAPGTYQDLWKTITAGREWRGEIQNRRKSGELYFERLNISPVLDESGAILNFIAVKEDVTERKQADDRIRRLNRVYAVLSGINTLIVRARERDELFQEACRIAVEHGNFSLAWIGLVDEDNQTVVPCATSGEEQGLLPKFRLSTRADLPSGQGPVGIVVRSGMPFVSNDMARDAKLVVAAQNAPESRSMVVLPLRVGGKTVGVMELGAKAAGFFDDAEMRLLMELAGDISFAIDHIEKEDKVARLTRVYAVLSGINAAIVRIKNRKELCREVCRIAVEAGGFPKAWLGLIDRESKQFRIVASNGGDPLFFRELEKELGKILPAGRGLVARALATRQPVISNDVTGDPEALLKDAALAAGVRSVADLPLIVSGEVVGVLALNANAPGFFDDREMKLLVELAGDISFALEHMEKAEKLDYLAYYDELTGLANATLFHELLAQHVVEAGNSQKKMALLMLDVERFKTINDALGRQAGDELLKQIAGRFAKSGGDAARFARVGADHFAAVIPEVKSEDRVARRVESWLRECFDPPFLIGESELRVSARVGIAVFPADGSDAEELFRNAEAALKKAKSGGERYLFYTQKMTERIAEKLSLESKLRQALEKEEFVLHYQPKVDLETRSITGMEALIRWQSPELGLVPPMKFIGLLEETGLILPAGSWALKRAALDHRAWVEAGLKPPRVAVNVSAIQLRQHDFVATVEHAIMDGVAPTGIDLELTESLVMGDIQANIEKLQAVRGLGIRVAIDDFGTGYSSLGYLAKLPVEYLKIDRSFIIAMHTDPDAMTLVSTIISLAHSLRLKVIAEGVETEEQAKFLRLLRCDEMQGYLFSKPLPLEQMTALLKAK